MDQGVSEISVARKENGSTLSDLRNSILSGDFYLVELPVWCDSIVMLVLKGEKIVSELAAAMLNVRHESFLHMLEEGRLPCEKNDSEVLVVSNDLMEFKQKFDRERNEALDRLLQIDSEDDYI